MQYHLEYGRTGLSIELPNDRPVQCLAYKEARPLPDPEASLDQALSSPTGTLPLAELARSKKSACIVICDITRPVPNELILTPILKQLEESGIARESITILIATGLHRPNEGEELIEIVGQHIAENYRIINHDGQNREQHDYLGESPNGVPIWIDRRYLEADLKITVGLIEPHFMAGFSGGRKLICPGIAHLDTIRAWHSPKFLEHPKACAGSLIENPVHAENTWIAQQAGCDFIVNVVIDAHRQPLAFVAGDMIAAFEEGVEFVREIVVDRIEQPVDIVVTSSAGYPLDATFYQSVKAMVGASQIVKPGGTIIVAACISEGVGSPEFDSLFDVHKNLEDFMKAIEDPDYFVMDQWQLEEMAKAARKAEIVMVSEGLSSEALKRLYVNSCKTVELAVEQAIEKHGPDATIAVIPKGPYVLAEVG
ncbi:MAG: hypothetical protein COA78_27625 [Blastopirellula sp.]|nr:MAG: hypothetical protein COA78_27625 [Blastopirellula sp.]